MAYATGGTLTRHNVSYVRFNLDQLHASDIKIIGGLKIRPGNSIPDYISLLGTR
jgi:hypothetical protein